jgi:hypothetical protein
VAMNYARVFEFWRDLYTPQYLDSHSFMAERLSVGKLQLFRTDTKWCYINLEVRSDLYFSDDGGSNDLWYVGKFLPDYMALQCKKQPSSHLPSLKLKVLLRASSSSLYKLKIAF